MSAARHPKSVFAQWYVSAAYICVVNSGNAIPKRFRESDWPASAEDANVP